MTADRRSGVVMFNCDGDGCRANYEGDDEDDFRAAWSSARQMGWVNSEHRGTWRHYCPRCKHQVGD